MNYMSMKKDVLAQIVDYINGNYTDHTNDAPDYSSIEILSPFAAMSRYRGTKAGKEKWLADKIEAGRAAQAKALRDFEKGYGENVKPDDVIEAINRERILNWEKGKKEKDCYKNWRLEEFLCKAAYNGSDFKTCIDRASNNRSNCDRFGNYNGLGILTREESSGKPQATLPDLEPKSEGKSETNPQGSGGTGTKSNEFGVDNVLANAALMSSSVLNWPLMLHLYLSQPETQQKSSEGFQKFLQAVTLPNDMRTHGVGSNPVTYGPPLWLGPALAGGL